MKTLTSYTKNRVIAPILIGFSILIGVLIIKPMYLDYIETSASVSAEKIDLISKTAERDALLQIKNNSGSGISEALKTKVKQLDQKFVPSDLIAETMLNKFTDKDATGIAPITISSISVDKGSKLPSGLSLGHVNLSLQAPELENIIAYLTYLTTQSHFAFTLDDISLPLDTNPENGTVPTGYGLTISLGVYYYE